MLVILYGLWCEYDTCHSFFTIFFKSSCKFYVPIYYEKLLHFSNVIYLFFIIRVQNLLPVVALHIWTCFYKPILQRFKRVDTIFAHNWCNIFIFWPYIICIWWFCGDGCVHCHSRWEMIVKYYCLPGCFNASVSFKLKQNITKKQEDRARVGISGNLQILKWVTRMIKFVTLKQWNVYVPEICFSGNPYNADILIKSASDFVNDKLYIWCTYVP